MLEMFAGALILLIGVCLGAILAWGSDHKGEKE